MTSNLERRHRLVLRLLPGWYRRQWELGDRDDCRRPVL